MGIFSGLFHSRDKPKNRTSGSAYTFYTGRSTAGKAVTQRSAMQMTAVYSCVRILSEAIASLPLHLYRYTESGGKEKATDSPLYFLLHDDLSLRKDNNTLIAIEVKDKTQTIDWNNIDRAKKIIKANPNLINFIFVLEKRDATVTDTIQEMIRSPQFQSEPCRIITFISVHDLFLLALSSCNEITIINRTSYYLSLAPAVKPETKKAWLQETSVL